MKGKQYTSYYRVTLVYPALLPTIKTHNKLPSSTVNSELSCRIRELVLT